MKKIVYIGNNLPNKNPTTLSLLSYLLKGIGFDVLVFSDKSSKILRLLDMCMGVLKNRKATYVLIDTYSTSNFYFTVIVSQLARILQVPYIPILHGGNLPQRLKRSPKLCDLIFNKAFVNVAPSNYLLTAFQQHNYKTIFIPNAIEIVQYSFKKRMQLQPNLLWVRAFDEIYNPQMAIKVLVELKKKYPRVSLCMVGPDKDGSLKDCMKLAKELDVMDAIEFTGLLSKNEWIEKSKGFDIFINTTNIDNTPVSVLESIALGLPVISTNVGGLPFLINNNETGILVPQNGVAEMVQGIQRLVESPNEAVQMAMNARTLVENFDAAVVKKQWSKLLME